MKSLSTFLHSLRERFDEFKNVGAELSGKTNCVEKVRTCKRIITLNPLDYGRAEGARYDLCKSFRVGAFTDVLDVLSSGIDMRAKAYYGVSDSYGFLCNVTEMEVMEQRETRQAYEKLVKLYSPGLDDRLLNELIQFDGLVAETLTGDLEHEVSPGVTMYRMHNLE